MTRLYLVRHGRAAAGWDTDADPGLDDIGREQAAALVGRLATLGPLEIVTSPLLRCQQTASALAEQWRVTPRVEPRVAEIPSPAGVPMVARVEWLRLAMAGTWQHLDARYLAFREGALAALAEIAAGGAATVVTTHFVAINAVIGAALGDDRLLIRSLDNCSVTIVDVDQRGRSGLFQLVEAGQEADTLIR
ncbi:MAG: histidine phosphatase family protein [Actinobacteria bacterium]|nr:histidine phosphatase family protein [Actinomycetota bacterium]